MGHGKAMVSNILLTSYMHILSVIFCKSAIILLDFFGFYLGWFFNGCSIDSLAARVEEVSHFIDCRICWSLVLHVVDEARCMCCYYYDFKPYELSMNKRS